MEYNIIHPIEGWSIFTTMYVNDTHPDLKSTEIDQLFAGTSHGFTGPRLRRLRLGFKFDLHAIGTCKPVAFKTTLSLCIYTKTHVTRGIYRLPHE